MHWFFFFFFAILIMVIKMDVDIIIPSYNSRYTLKKTLYSLAIQRQIHFSVYLVNDASDYLYTDYIEYFSSFFPIEEIILPENVGPGFARNQGIYKGNAKYILFIDSDDCFYGPYSIYHLYHEIVQSKSDLVISNFIYERDNVRIIKKYDHVWLHGKIYSRSFLKKHNILFNNTRANEDNGFNQLILLLNPKVSYLDEVTYVYCDNKQSITRKNNRQYKLNGLEGFVQNIVWSIKEGINRKCCSEKIVSLTVSTLVAMYYYYLELTEYDNSKILIWSKELWLFYNSLSDLITDDIIDISLSAKRKMYQNEGKEILEFISFNDFIKKVGDTCD